MNLDNHTRSRRFVPAFLCNLAKSRWLLHTNPDRIGCRYSRITSALSAVDLQPAACLLALVVADTSEDEEEDDDECVQAAREVKRRGSRDTRRGHREDGLFCALCESSARSALKILCFL